MYYLSMDMYTGTRVQNPDEAVFISQQYYHWERDSNNSSSSSFV